MLSANVTTWAKNLLPELQKREKLVIILSSYSDEVFLNNLMQELNRESFDKKEIIVYGLSPWLNLEKVDFLLMSVIINFSLNFTGETDFFLLLPKSSRTKPFNIEGVISELSSVYGNNL